MTQSTAAAIKHLGKAKRYSGVLRMPGTTAVEIIILCGPKLSKYLMDKIRFNRGMRPKNVFQFSQDMKNKQWFVEASRIMIDWNNKVIDGYHTLNAIIESGISVWVKITLNCDPELVHKLDGGANRTLCDTMKTLGEDYPSNMAVAVNAVYRWENSNLQRRDQGSSIPQSKAKAFIEKYPEVRTASAFLSKHPLLRYAGMYLVYAMGAVSFEDDAVNDFAEGVSFGGELDAKDPRRLLHDKLCWYKSVECLRLDRYEQMALTILAWNAYVAGKDLDKLEWPAKERNRMVTPDFGDWTVKQLTLSTKRLKA